MKVCDIEETEFSEYNYFGNGVLYAKKEGVRK